MYYFGLAKRKQRAIKGKKYAEAVISFLPLKNRFGWIILSILIYLCVAKWIFGNVQSIFIFCSVHFRPNVINVVYFFGTCTGVMEKEKKLRSLICNA